METAADIREQRCSCGSASFRCWCLDCNEALCYDCLSAHRRVTLTRSHRILNQPPAGDVSTPPIKFCRLHPSEPLKLFCFTCNQFTCRDCQLASHMNHSYQFVKEALNNVKQQLEEVVQPITAQRDTVRRSLMDMKIRLQDIVDSRSNLKSELERSFNVVVEHLSKRMQDILKQAEELCLSEFKGIKKRMTKMKQLWQNQQLVTEIVEKARNTNELSALMTYLAQVKYQLKARPDLDVSPPQIMSHLKVVTDRTSLEAILNFGALEVSWIPFFVLQTSNQKTPNASSSSPTILVRPPPPYRPLPQTRKTFDSPVAPVPVSCSSTFSKSLSSMLHLSPFSSSTVIPTTSTCLVPSCGTLPQNRNTWDNDSPVPVNCPSTSRKMSSNQFSHPSSSSQGVNQSKTPLTTIVPVTSTQTVQQPSSTKNSRLVWLLSNPTSGDLPPVSVHHPPSADPSLVFQLVQPPLGLNKPPAPQNQNQCNAVLLSNTQTLNNASCFTLFSVMPQFPMLLSPTSPGNTSPEHQKSLMGIISPQTLPATTKGNPISGGPSGTALHRPLKDIRFTTTSSSPSCHQCLTPDISPHSSLKDQQQSPVVRAVADSACNRNIQPVAAKRPEPAENEPTSTVSEEPAPAGGRFVFYRKASEPKPSPEVSDTEPEEPEPAPEVSHTEPEPAPEVSHTEPEQSSVIGHLDCIMGRWQPRLSLSRLPVTPPRPGGPDPCFGLVTGDPEDEIYLKEMREDTQTHAGEVTDDIIAESPVTLVTVSCSACHSASSSIICSFCGRGYHRDCHDPPVGPDLRSEWTCTLCQDLFDTSDPFSSDRPPRPQSPCLSLWDQRRCERLLLYLKVEGCTQLSQQVEL
ncbi:E3 ubiquitin-protein ligase TRIM33 isoform X2 [Cebidichthys violaceus]|uniref:E3 ubiquitin-protein ligase TRIM33 isoform X2 n=1 Tax=Cebidichthys violaceus TaxID=271503 RepID=UPI0035CA4334